MIIEDISTVIDVNNTPLTLQYCRRWWYYCICFQVWLKWLCAFRVGWHGCVKRHWQQYLRHPAVYWSTVLDEDADEGTRARLQSWYARFTGFNKTHTYISQLAVCYCLVSQVWPTRHWRCSAPCCCCPRHYSSTAGSSTSSTERCSCSATSPSSASPCCWNSTSSAVCARPPAPRYNACPPAPCII